MAKVKKIILLILLINFVTVPCIGQTLKELVSAEQGEVIEGKDGWLFLKEELEHMTAGPFWGEHAANASKTVKKEFADPLPAIVDFNDQLKSLGIELLLVPVPPKGLIYSEKLPVDASAAVAELNKNYDSFYSLLKADGVDVIDLRKAFIEKRHEKNIYCKTDTHFSGDGIARIVSDLGNIIVDKSWYIPLKNEYDINKHGVDIVGDLIKMSGRQGNECIELQFIADKTTEKAPEESDESPILLLGDSHTLVFSSGGDLFASGAGLFENLAARLQMNLDRIGVRGSGATPSRIKLYQKSRKNTDYLAKKKLIIWCFAAREFTGVGGWRKVPFVKK